LHLRWAGFRKVRRQVCRRVARRVAELELPDLDDYRAHLESHEEEWRVLDGLCRITISRFHRDRGVWEALRNPVLPELARAAASRGDVALRAWSAGCASGEEPYTLVALWRLGLTQRERCGLQLCVVGTDVDAHLLERARVAEYGASSLRELPDAWRSALFVPVAGRFRVRAALRERVSFRRADVRRPARGGPYHLVLCRNLAFTYFDEAQQRHTLALLADALTPGGALVIGSHESLPAGAPGFAGWLPQRGIWRRASGWATPGPRA
jgi:chemotaxis protein methyltransferase CheR